MVSTEPTKYERVNGEDVITVFNKDVFSRSVLRSYLTEKYYNEFLECFDSYKVAFLFTLTSLFLQAPH